MKRSITFFILLCLSGSSFSQKGITNKSHPFQVLFTENSFINGKEIMPLDYVSNKARIHVEGNVTLVHFSNRVFEFSDTVISVNKIFRLRNNLGGRPALDEVMVCSHDCPELSIIFPPNYNYIHHNDSSLKVMWDFELYSSSAEYQISVVNIFNELLYELKTKDKECIIPPEKLQTKEGLLIVRLQIDNNHSEIGFRIREAYEHNYQMDYQLLLVAIEMSFIRSDIANIFYKYSIQESNQDPRFIQLYEDFLERNPQFKEEAE